MVITWDEEFIKITHVPTIAVSLTCLLTGTATTVLVTKFTILPTKRREATTNKM